MGAELRAFILTRPALTIAIIVSALALIGLFGVWLFTGSIGNDFGVYWRTANLPVFWAYWHGFKYPFPYMPTMLLWIAPLKAIPFWPAYFMWAAVSILALVAAARPYLSRPELWLLVLSPALTNGLMTGQVSAMMAALLIWALATRNRYAAGIAFGIVASIKPQLAVMVPLLLLLRQDWRAIGSSAATFALLVVASTMLFGGDIWNTWIGSLPEFRFRLEIMGISGISPAAVADGFGLNPLPFLVLGGGLGVWLVYACRNMPPIETAAAIGTASILAAPYALTYDLAVIAPFLVCAVFRKSVVAAVGLSGVVPPLPLVLSGFLLVRSGLHGRVGRISGLSALGQSGDADPGDYVLPVRPVVEH